MMHIGGFLLFAACLLAPLPTFADEVISLGDGASCAVHEVDYAVRTVDCIENGIRQSRWICSLEGETVCRLEGDRTVSRSFLDPFDGHLCRELCRTGTP